jgi:hypothetical protein
MKKLFFILFIFSICNPIFSQEGLYFGAHYSYNSSWLMNKQVFDQDAEMDVAITFGNFYGIIAGYNFTDKFGVEINANVNNINQDYEGELKYPVLNEINTYVSSIQISTLDVPVLAKFGYDNYFEVGPVLQLVNSASFTRVFDNSSNLTTNVYNGNLFIPSEVDRREMTDYFSQQNIAIAFGFGTKIDIIQYKLQLNLGVRFQYTITDMQGINGLGVDEDGYNRIDNTQILNYFSEEQIKNFSNNALIGGVKIGLTYYVF